MSANDDRQRELEVALAHLVEQIDIAEYRDELGHPLKNNLAYTAAEDIVRRYGLTHERLCEAMDEGGLHALAIARLLAA